MHRNFRSFQRQRAPCDHDVPAFEKRAHLARLPERGFLLAALPMKIRDGTGAPLRAVALLP